MGTNYIAPTWRVPRNANKDKLSNYSINFTGNEYITCDVITQLGNKTQATWSGWFNRSNTASYYIMSSWGTSGTDRQFLVLQTPTRLAVWMGLGQYGNQRPMFDSSSLTFTTGVWYHLMFVYNESEASNADKMKVYINNVVQTNEIAGSAINFINPVTSPFIIGTIGGYLTNEFQGQISQVSIFDYALSADQRSYLYNLNNPMAISGAEPVAYWPLGDNSNPIATAGYPNISVGADSVFDFDSSGPDYITTPGIDIGKTNTLSFWIKRTAVGNQVVLNNNHNNAWYNYIVRLVSNGDILYATNANGASTTFNNANTRTLVNALNVWINIVIVRTEQNVVCYVNNQNNDGTKTLTNNNWDTVIDNIGVAGDNSSFPFDGELSNIQLWNTDLSSSEVETLYNNGQPLMTGTQPQENNLKAWYKLNQSANWEADTAGDWQIPDNRSSFPTSFNISGSSQMVVMNTNAISDLNSIAGSFSASIWFKTNATGAKALMRRTRAGGPIRDLGWAFGKDSYYNNGAYLVFSIYNTNGDFIQIRNVNNTSTSYAQYNPNFLDAQGDPMIVVNDDKWHHGLCVYDEDNSNIKIYVDGVLQNSVTVAGFGNYPLPIFGNMTAGAGGSRTSIGGTNNGSAMNSLVGRYDGELSNAKVWNKALSSDNAISLYNSGVPLTANAVEPNNLISWNKLDSDDSFRLNAENKGNWAIFNQTASPAVSSSYLSFINDGIASRNPGPYGGFNWTGFRTANFSDPTSYHQLTSDHLSFSCWFRFEGPYTTASLSNLVSFGTGYYLTMTYHDNGILRIYGDISSRYMQAAATPVTNGEWHNIIMYAPNATTNTANGMRIFVDGEEYHLTTNYPNFQYSKKESILGSFNYAGGGAPPKPVAYADWVIYDTDITSNVSTIYNNGVPNDVSSLNPFLYYKFDSANCKFISDGNNSRMEFTDLSGNNRGAFGPWNNLSGNNSPRLKSGKIRGGSFSLQGNTSITLTEQNLVNNNVSTVNAESSGMTSANLVQSNLTRKKPFSSYSIKFDSADGDYAITQSGVDSILSGATSFTISSWVNFNDASALRPIATNWVSASTSYNYILRYYQSQIQFYVRANGSTGNATYSFTPDLNRWYNIVGTWDGINAGPINIYIDGVAGGVQGTRSGTMPTITTSEMFGRYVSSVNYYHDGELSNIAYWKNQLLTEDDILNIYNNGVSQDLNNFKIPPTNWYPMDESYTYFDGTNLILRDAISGRDATGYNINQENILGNAPGSEANGTGTNLNISYLKSSMKNSINNSYSINMGDYASGTNPANSGRSTNVP